MERDVVVEDGEEQLLFVAEVLVDGSLADAGALGDGIDGGGLVALFGEDLGGGAKDRTGFGGAVNGPGHK